jgi:hypothetical protein
MQVKKKGGLQIMQLIKVAAIAMTAGSWQARHSVQAPAAWACGCHHLHGTLGLGNAGPSRLGLPCICGECQQLAFARMPPYASLLVGAAVKQGNAQCKSWHGCNTLQALQIIKQSNQTITPGSQRVLPKAAHATVMSMDRLQTQQGAKPQV